jgi:hypothetical protein
MHVKCLSRAPVALGFLFASISVCGATPGFWQAATQADFLRGDLENLSLDEHGRIMLGPRVERVYDPAVPFIWTATEGRDGELFLGTGNDGRVFRVDREGRGSVFFDSTELEVHALALGPNGSLFVGTSPDGRIYQVDAKGVATSFFDPEDKYIWSLVVDREGVLYAGTGDKGAVYRITPDGTGSKFFSTRTTHAVSLALDAEGQLLVGTGTPGRVFRVDHGGKGFLVLDTPYQEIRALRLLAGGEVFVAAQSGRPPQGGEDRPEQPSEPPRAPTPSVSTEITSFAVIDVPVSTQAPAPPAGRDDRRGPSGAVYRVTKDGLWDQVWESREDAPYDLAVEGDGSLLVATGGRGKLYRLAGDPLRPTLLARVSAEQTTMLHRSRTRTWLVTANPGLVFSLSGERADRGSYESDVRDARTVATWGALSWRAVTPGGTRIEIYTRSGNTRTPDEAWSDWTGPYTEPNGSTITSPKARYLQWRAVLTGGASSPVLTSVMAAYLQRNSRPEVASITVHPPGIVFQRPFSTGETEIAGFDGETPDRRQAESAATPGGPAGAPALGRRSYQKGLQTFAWKAEDENGDELTFDVLYRRQGDTSWKLLKSGLTDSILVWDTTSAPNGAYSLKVVASDERSNPAQTALKGEMESVSFDIDNTAPAVTVGPARREGNSFVVALEVRDADSPIRQVEYSIETERWQSAFPRDGLLDSRLEQVDIRLDQSAAGRTLVVRATDAMNNVGGAHVTIK